MAFQDFKPVIPMLSQKLIGFKHFVDLFEDVIFLRALRNLFTTARKSA